MKKIQAYLCILLLIIFTLSMTGCPDSAGPSSATKTTDTDDDDDKFPEDLNEWSDSDWKDAFDLWNTDTHYLSAMYMWFEVSMYGDKKFTEDWAEVSVLLTTNKWPSSEFLYIGNDYISIPFDDGELALVQTEIMRIYKNFADTKGFSIVKVRKNIEKSKTDDDGYHYYTMQVTIGKSR